MDLHDAIKPDLPDIVLDACVVRTGLSVVWRGRARLDGRDVAVKLAADPARAAALRAEAETSAALDDAGVPGVLPVVFVNDPIPHLVSPWMGGRTLRGVIDEIRGGDDRSRATAIALELVKIVAGVHHAGFLHGDLKPENVLIDAIGRPWLTDFGMARVIQSARLDSRISVSMDQSQSAWGGTLPYLPPEGLQGDATSPAWDVYALGVILHEILLGRRPDRATTPEDLLARLPASIVDVLLQSLAYAPEDRYANASTLLLDLQAIEFELTATGLARWLVRSGRKLLVGLAAFFVALRYLSVLGLLAIYGAIVYGIYAGHPVFAVAFGPFYLLHTVIRWEGPETLEEARMRRTGLVAQEYPER